MRALIVDDSRALRKILGEMLRQAGITVTEAANGREALVRLSESRAPRCGLDRLEHARNERTGIRAGVYAPSQQYDALPIIMVTTETEIEQMSLGPGGRRQRIRDEAFQREVILDKMRILASARGLPMRKARILVVDDSVVIRSL